MAYFDFARLRLSPNCRSGFKSRFRFDMNCRSQVLSLRLHPKAIGSFMPILELLPISNRDRSVLGGNTGYARGCCCVLLPMEWLFTLPMWLQSLNWGWCPLHLLMEYGSGRP
ncbi:hypothetical protein Nepgr_030899 [Nepenthes gracilis]|uniref:Uncharacterized protein n=1 Tax=Nepenthes gracilis TaxID=150966 RepID=A0AAD3Y717_NEPGR|nr:hypothetical protein Nepgr_030899 [Nepenthes gracilis]